MIYQLTIFGSCLIQIQIFKNVNLQHLITKNTPVICVCIV